ncbi:MAG: AraC family transcriptional regulator [Opitutaceae bacterium]|nr:AraC family transcriptional regulator [Opitutaceae bacterium]
MDILDLFLEKPTMAGMARSSVPAGRVKDPAPPAFISRQTGRRRYFFNNLAPAPAAPGVVVACGGWERCAPDYVVERADFRFHAVEFVAQGRGSLEIFGHERPLRAGSLFSYGPGVAHRICSDPAEPLEKYFVDFSGRKAAGLARELQAAGVVRVARREFAQTWFEQLLETGAQAGGGAAGVCALLVELIVRHALLGPPLPAGTTPVSRMGYERCVMLLRDHFPTLASADELARMAHMDAAYMTRLFQRHGGESPYRMLVRLKMHRAAERLVSEARSLKEIGAEVGFADPYHFSRVFKRVHGLPPRRFQENYHRGKLMPSP